MNLFDHFDNTVDSAFLEKLGTIIPEHNASNIKNAVDGVFNTLLAGLIRRTNSDMSSSMLYNQVVENNNKSGFIDDFMEKASTKAYTDKCVVEGSKVISQIFPAYKSPLLSLIGSYAGTNKNASTLISSIVSLILIDIFGKQIDQQKLDKIGMINYLREHHEPLFEKMPESLTEKMIPALGLQELTNAKSYIAKRIESNTIKTPMSVSGGADEDEDEGQSGGVNKGLILGLLVTAVLGMGAYLVYANKDKISFLNGSNNEPSEEMQFADSLNAVALDTLKADTLITPKGDSLEIAPISDFLKMQEYIQNSSAAAGESIPFPSIQFVEPGIDLTEASMPVIDSLASLMKRYSKIQLKVTAFSKNGDQKTNNKRAFAIKKRLMSQGVPGIKIDAVSGGIGEGTPTIKVVTK